MSSLRNAIKRVTHKERSQPRSRSHLGLLEKKGDYKKRSDNFHKKERRLAAMGARAANRNPDEFYMAMHNAEIDHNGKHRKTDKAVLSEQAATLGADAIKIMKTQDLKYLRAVVSRDKKKEESLRASLHFDHEGRGRKNKRTLFVDGGREEAEAVLERLEDEEDGESDEEDEGAPLPTTSAGGTSEDDEYDLDLSALRPAASKTPKQLKKERRAKAKLDKSLDKARLKSYASLRDRSARRGKVEVALAFMETERNMTSKGAKRKVRDGEDGKPPVFKWRRKRAK
mmetsp:Transcript_3399/g.7189  ORF Transcript_3399/g.7189 Transcript_3399/m.7189 type:complete len:284 (+) Transcript_3399:230-1081(+)